MCRDGEPGATARLLRPRHLEDAHGPVTVTFVGSQDLEQLVIGAVELAEDSPEGRSVSEQYEARKKAAADRLKQIRESMNRD